MRPSSAVIGLAGKSPTKGIFLKFDFSGKIYTDVSGLNDHTTRSHHINNVGAFSYACQVTQDDKEHMIKMAVCMRSAELYANIFSYALFQD